MTSVEQALSVAQSYVAEHRPGCRVSGLLEDSQDFLVALDSDLPTPIGWALIFVRKSTGRIWTAAPGDGFNKMDRMRQVTLPRTSGEPS